MFHWRFYPLLNTISCVNLVNSRGLSIAICYGNDYNTPFPLSSNAYYLPSDYTKIQWAVGTMHPLEIRAELYCSGGEFFWGQYLYIIGGIKLRWA